MAQILLIEDDTNTRLVTRLYLKQEHTVLEAEDGMQAMEVLEHKKIDLILADIMMPHMDGYEFVKQLRGMDQQTPVLFLSAKREWADKKQGFLLGIDDYMTKPVNYEELLWKIRILLRRARIFQESKIEIGEITLDVKSFTVQRGTDAITLPKKEFELLYKLLSYPNVVFTKVQLLEDIWGYDCESDETTVRTHINRLRNRFEGTAEFSIVTVRGLGYKGEIHV